MIKTTLSGHVKLTQYLVNLPKRFRSTAMNVAAKFFIGDAGHGLKHEPAWKFVSRAQAYGKVSDAPPGYFSWKQFRYVAWKTKGFTEIPYKRTHGISDAWKIQESGNWMHVKITNDADGVAWVMGDKQARQPALVGWRKYAAIIKSNMRGAIHQAQLAVNRMLKEGR